MNDANIFSEGVPALLEQHFAHLHDGSGISVPVILERGYRSILSVEDLGNLGFSKAQHRVSGILVPIWGVDGTVVGYQYRPDRPRSRTGGAPIKYENPRGSALRLDCPPRCRETLGDPSVPLWITEGVKKVDALASRGLCAMGLFGVWGFKGKNAQGGITLLADWDEVALNERRVSIVFDSDVVTKPEVTQAVQRLAEHLQRRKADVYQVCLPSATGEKVGVDDYLLQHPVDDLVALAKPLEAIDVATSQRVSQINQIVQTALNGEKEPKAAIEELREGGGHRHKVRSAISYLVICLLRGGGFFVRAPEDRHYFYSPTKELLPLDSFAFGALLNKLFGLNQSEPEFRHVLADANTEAHFNGRTTAVYRFAFYYKATNTLYIDRFDGNVYRLDGENIDLIENGVDGILFVHQSTWEPYQYLGASVEEGLIAPTLIEDINFISDGSSALTPEEQRSCLLLWLLSVFFESRQPTKPILVFVGEKGSGKTTALRRILRFFFGSLADVATLEREKEDAFIAVITSHYVAAFDNVDGRIAWLNDRLATAATGGFIQRRRLYTTNELASYFPRCFVAMTSRLPTFKREDVADRLLILRVRRLDGFRSEEEMLEHVDSKRNVLWTELLNDLDAIIASLKKAADKHVSNFRLADWAGLCMDIAESQGVADAFSQIVAKLGQQQSAFALEDDPLFICLQEWLTDPANQGRQVAAAELCKELETMANLGGIEWPYRNARSVGKRLGNIRSNLQDFFDVATTLDARNRRWYCFRLRTERVGGMII